MKKPWWKSGLPRYLTLSVLYYAHALCAACLFVLLTKPGEVGLFEKIWSWVALLFLIGHWVAFQFRRKKYLLEPEAQDEAHPPPSYRSVVGRIGTGGIRTRMVDTTMSDPPPVVRGHRVRR